MFATRCSILCLLIVTLPFASCSEVPDRSATTSAPNPEATPTIQLDPDALEMAEIDITEVTESALPQVLEAVGRLGLNENRVARVGALVHGRIVGVAANVGDRVREGQILAEVRSYEVDDARSQYTKAVAQLERSQSQLEYAVKIRDRAAKLLSLKAGSLEDLQRAESDVHRAETEVQISHAEIGRLEELLEHMGVSTQGARDEYSGNGSEAVELFEELERVPVKSPIEGTVLERMITPGSVVSPSDDLFVVSDLSTLWVHAEVPEAYLASLRTGYEASVSVDAYPGMLFPARLTQIGDVLNPATRTVQVRCEAANARGRLRAEMYAQVLFELESDSPSIVVPKSALQDLEGRQVVFVEVERLQFEPRPVETGRVWKDQVSVLRGLRVGERVVASGSFLLKSEMLRSRMEEE